MIRIKRLVCPHNSYEVFRFTQVDDIVRVSRKHMNRFNLITRNLKLDNGLYFYCIYLNKGNKFI